MTSILILQHKVPLTLSLHFFMSHINVGSKLAIIGIVLVHRNTAVKKGRKMQTLTSRHTKLYSQHRDPNHGPYLVCRVNNTPTSFINFILY